MNNKISNKMKKMANDELIYHLNEFNYYTKHRAHLQNILAITGEGQQDALKMLIEDINTAEERIDYHYKKVEEQNET